MGRKGKNLPPPDNWINLNVQLCAQTVNLKSRTIGDNNEQIHRKSIRPQDYL